MHDLRSDTVTQPTPAMRAAMAAAPVGDDVFGEDPSVNQLEAQAAELFGKPAALFVPSGTMGNQLCLGALTSPGDEIIAEAQAHILLNEVGSAARLWSCQIRALPGRRGLLDAEQVRATIRAQDIHYPRTALLSLENTHNFAGGAVLPQAEVDALIELAREHGLAVHMDGARLLNAAVASGLSPARLLQGVDLASVCLSKGLGAPVGSVVVGEREPMERCRKLRKALGGGMRQAGVIAAAASIALAEGPALMADDHRRARTLAEALDALPGASVDLEAVHTNIVFVDTRDSASAAQQAFERAGVAAIALGEKRLRFVFHRDVGDDALQATLQAATTIFA
ncbi:MAG: threonine aldolase [Planctomycetota bacterium]|nr:MAG: threonine aldolase [Planctomycetota bacterium]